MGQTATTTALATVGGIAGLALIAWPVAIWWEVRKCEKPRFTLLRTLGSRKTWWGATVPAAEVRLYAPYLCAEVSMSGGADMDMRKALGGGFRQIAGFIFGKNIASASGDSAKVAMTSPVTLEMSRGGTGAAAESAKIAMTSPVTADLSGTGQYKVSFIMPSEYTAETLPKPVNPDVQVKEMPARTMVALAWHGKSPREAEVERKSAELRAVMAAAGLKPKGPVHCWQYDPPFQWRWLRTNEVLYEVEGEAAGATATS